MEQDALCAEDLDLIRRQLGRAPRGIAAIVARSESGAPLVLQMHSVVDETPFPTLYWLSSRDLYTAIAGLETRGVVKELEQRLETDATMREALATDHRRYIEKRQLAMLPEHREWIASRNLQRRFDSAGVGGIERFDKIRCLHMHYAHHLADGNSIGAILDQEFGLKELEVRS